VTEGRNGNLHYFVLGDLCSRSQLYLASLLLRLGFSCSLVGMGPVSSLCTVQAMALLYGEVNAVNLFIR